MLLGKVISCIMDGTIYSLIGQRTIERWYSLSEDKVFEKQRNLLQYMLQYVMKHCQYYHEINGLDYKDITTFPIVDKKLITAKFDEFCSDIKKWFRYGEGYTGGSTGEPFRMLRCGGYEYDFGLRKWRSYGYKDGDMILAMDGQKVDDAQIAVGKYVYKKDPRNIPFGSMGLSSLYLTDKTARIYCEAIRDVDPSFIRGYPSFIYAVACYAEQYGIKLGRRLKGIELTSESAYDYQIEKIQRVYHAPVHLQYGHTEAVAFGYTFNNTYRYRVEPLYGFIEVLNEHDRQVELNETGEVVVTTLHNYAMPLIRYRTGDYAKWGGKDDRYVYLNKIMGRTQDYIINRRGDKVLLTALIFGQHVHAMGHIVKWQLEQYELGGVIVHIVRGGNYSLEDEKELFRLFSDIGDVEPTFDYVDIIKPTPRGKSKMLIQHLNKR